MMTRSLGQARAAEEPDHRAEGHRRDGEVVEAGGVGAHFVLRLGHGGEQRRGVIRPAVANDRRLTNFFHAPPVGFIRPNWRTASRA